MASTQNIAASAQLGRYQPTALDVAREAERTKLEARSTALHLAASTGEPAQDVVERAAAYLNFLTA